MSTGALVFCGAGARDADDVHHQGAETFFGESGRPITPPNRRRMICTTAGCLSAAWSTSRIVTLATTPVSQR
jgi:hypothetical protein